MRNEMPTAEKLRNDVISGTDMDMPTISTRTMQRMLNDLGFLFRKRKRNSALLERDDIVAWRRKYLRTIREMRRQQRTIYYLDETWVNAGHTKETVWTDTKVMSRQDAFRQGLSTGLRAPSGKGGRRLIVLHAGSAEGFVDGAALVFRAKKGTGKLREAKRPGIGVLEQSKQWVDMQDFYYKRKKENCTMIVAHVRSTTLNVCNCG
ncbi:hypothetical protein HPB50_000957 [Hyalomma asiaticum]|uniref:Uncharacterized protein n=1 Tax=Hyalomma asiaticum TaxID=266040 RepID=A0ACB7S6H9_HYAAI|nr:hypothetical protein HPB50_000957 [Hyalomma asiaticum]